MKLLLDTQHFNLQLFIYALAAVFIIIESFNLPTRLKILFGLKISKRYKLIDCMPCLSFWLSLIFTLNLPTAFAIFIVIKFYDKHE